MVNVEPQVVHVEEEGENLSEDPATARDFVGNSHKLVFEGELDWEIIKKLFVKFALIYLRVISGFWWALDTSLVSEKIEPLLAN